MSYDKTLWKDRDVQHPDRFELLPIQGNLYTIRPSPGTIAEQGTPIDAEKLNNIEKQYEKAVEDAEGGGGEVITVDTTYNIGIQEGDYASLQSAIDDLSSKRVKSGVRLILKVRSGYRIGSGVLVQNGNYGHFWIESADSEIEVSDAFSGHGIHGINANMPVLNTILNLRGFGTSGYFAQNLSTGYIYYDGNTNHRTGIKNATANGIAANYGSVIVADRTIVNGANRGYNAGINSSISAFTSKAENIVYAGYFLSMGSTLTAQASECKGAQFGAYADATSNGDFRTCDFSNSTARGIYAYGGSRINARQAVCTGCGTAGIGAGMGSSINAWGANAQKGGSPASEDIQVHTGSTIVATTATGNYNVTKNTVTADGIIFDD